jgi:serine-type D-Ala-D-Ala carboxypeptidase (penicillin-binding protein 5/6)
MNSGPGRPSAVGLLTLVALLFISGCGGKDRPAPAQAPKKEPRFIFAGRPLQIPPLPCVSAVLIEPVTNTVLYDQNSHVRRAPASIAKMTLELVTMNEIAGGKLALTDSIKVSGHASKIGGSQVYLAEGEVFPLEQLMQAISIHSANDACSAVAEHIAGTDDGFVQLMNQEVEVLQLNDTHYVNCHGLDDEPGIGNYSCAYDIAQIARELIRFPKILEWSSTIEAPFRGGAFLLQNTNKLLGRFEGIDGLKTGYTEKAGFCLCATGKRSGFRLISVVMGADSNKHRFEETARLMGAGFNSYSVVDVCRAGDALGDEMQIAHAEPKSLKPAAGEDVTLVVSRPDDRKLKKEFIPVKGLKAPIKAGTEIGKLRISSGDQVLAEVPAVAPVDVRATGIRAWLHRMFTKG